jgi:chromosome segregation ATPase
MTADDLQQEIERTRERLGETVDELAAKADVKGRARAKATKATARARDKAAKATGQARDQAAKATAQARDQAAKATAQARDQVAEVSGRVTANDAVRRRWPLAAAAVVAIAATVVIWRCKQA